MSSVLLIIPPFTQLNTPYPSTSYLKGFLNTKNIDSVQIDLSIEVINKIFSKEGLKSIFLDSENKISHFSKNSQRIFTLKSEYINSIDLVISFLQGKNSAIANLICNNNFLPQASRFQQTADFDWAFGTMGIQNKAKHLATLYLEDISDFITEVIDANFGFSRYAEKLGRFANSFDEIENKLNTQLNLIETILLQLLEEKIKLTKPSIIGISVPFAGNIYSALVCGKFIKENYPEIKIVMGGGFCNTELRSLSDIWIFKYIDFLTLDDGELPLFQIIEYIEKKIEISNLIRTFVLEKNIIKYYNNFEIKDFSINETGTPDYSDIEFEKYISAIEIANPMHSLWSDGNWIKLSIAHGCYWAKCSFCDTSLDYIKRHEPSDIEIICNRIEKLIKETGKTGFHFVDEAAPPLLLKKLALELIRRNIKISWWTNIRFEKSFTFDLCFLLKESGCIAVSGGLEVASDRILKLINKGVTIEQVAKAANNFAKNGIMVHSYLMYGFPSQTEQETIDSLEIVRQLFENGIIKSGFWHQFAMTVHSDIGKNNEKYFTELTNKTIGSFANNDLLFKDLKGCNHEKFSNGLKKSLYNFMHGIGFDFKLWEWFDFKVPATKIHSDFIKKTISESLNIYQTKNVVWMGYNPQIKTYLKTKKNQTFEVTVLIFESKTTQISLTINKPTAEWLSEILPKISIFSGKKTTFEDFTSDFEAKTDENFNVFMQSRNFKILNENGLIFI